MQHNWAKESPKQYEEDVPPSAQRGEDEDEEDEVNSSF